MIALAFWLSFWEGRWAGEPLVGRLDFAATENGVVFGLFPDRLKLQNEPIVGQKKLDETKREITSRGGDFVPTLNFDDRDLQAADLSGADLRGASLHGAAMQNANLRRARLDGAELDRTLLRGADLAEAMFQGADLTDAQLQGTALHDTHMQGAHLSSVGAQGAELIGAQLQGANLEGADLQGAAIIGAQLQGANLDWVHLQDAKLYLVQLQGVDFGGTEMADSEFDETFMFRAHATASNLLTSVVRSVRPDRTKLSAKDLRSSEVLTAADVDQWKAASTKFANEDYEASIAERFARLEPDFQTAEEDAVDVAKWREWEKQSVALDPDGSKHRRRLATILSDLACEADGAPYVARALVDPRNIVKIPVGARLAALGDQLGRVFS